MSGSSSGEAKGEKSLDTKLAEAEAKLEKAKAELEKAKAERAEKKKALLQVIPRKENESLEDWMGRWKDGGDFYDDWVGAKKACERAENACERAEKLGDKYTNDILGQQQSSATNGGSSVARLLVSFWREIVRFAESKEIIAKGGTLQFSNEGRSYVGPLDERNRPSKTGVLYVRGCYDEYYRLLRRASSEASGEVYIIGTPGIGKSAFRNYVLYRLAHDFIHKDNGTDTLVIGWYRSKQSDVVCFVLDRNLKCFVEVGSEKTPQVILVDVKNGDTSYPGDVLRTKPVFFSSPNENMLNSLRQDADAECIFVMPVWEKTEMDALYTQTRDAYRDLHSRRGKKLYEKRLSMYGGVPRSVFGSDKHFTDFDRRITNGVAKFLGNEGGGNAPAVVHRLEYLYPDSKDRTRSSSTVRIGTPYLRELLDNIMYKRHKCWLAILQAGIPPALNGCMYEQRCHRVLTEGKSLKLTVRSCVTGGRSHRSNDLKLDFTGLEKRYFWSLNEVDLSQNVYWIPYSPNFPAVDAITPQGMIQMTISDRHPVSKTGYDKVKAVYKAYGIENPPLVFFVGDQGQIRYQRQPFKGSRRYPPEQYYIAYDPFPRKRPRDD